MFLSFFLASLFWQPENKKIVINIYTTDDSENEQQDVEQTNTQGFGSNVVSLSDYRK